MSKPIATIGIAFRNTGPDFWVALKSVFAQSCPDWELILCDDGSADDALDLAYAIDDPRVRVVSDGFSKGLASRLNQMIDMALGRVFIRMDADDVMHPDRTKLLVETIADRSDLVVGSAAYAIDERSRVIGLKPAQRLQYRGFAARHSFFHPTLASSVQWFRTHHYSEEFTFHRSEDAELYCRTSDVSQFRWIGQPLMFIREVGVFSYRKHIGTSLGILGLIDDYSISRFHRIGLLSRELAKIWLMLTLSAFGRADLVVRRRGVSLSRPEREAGERMLAGIFLQELPLRTSATSTFASAGQ